MLRRIIPLVAILSLLSAVFPRRLSRCPPQTEIALGQAEDQQIVASSVIETDPLLNAYVQGIAEQPLESGRAQRRSLLRQDHQGQSSQLVRDAGRVSSTSTKG